MEREHFLTCAHCGDRIGIYERVIVVEHGRETSVAGEPELLDRRPVMMHLECADLASYGITEPG
ncbi:MAG: hypothetical protein ACLPTJ_15085 [Solirubrobacteraceae bacterium]